MLNERDKFWLMLLEERSKRNEERFSAQTLATEKALASSQMAINKSETAVEKRLENTNEWRAAMNDRDARLLPRPEFNAILTEWKSWRDTLETEHSEVNNRLTAIETRSVTWAAAILVFFTVVQIAMFWAFHK